MERLLLTTVACRTSNLVFESDYLPEFTPYLSQPDFESILAQLNKATKKGPNQKVIGSAYVLVFISVIALIVIGCDFISNHSYGKQDNFGLILVPVLFAVFIGIGLALYESATTKALETELRKTVKQISASMVSKRIRLQYSRDLYKVNVTVINGFASTEKKYDYLVDIYYLQDIQAPTGAYGNSVAVTMTPDMHAQFATFLAQQ
ncbi:hypothetical protein HDV01_000507 [Terramyces sp. JEL0728]|nr:hypothetical protein HDV01_000507 [Terramyces sp. JEL0728]